MLIYGFNELLQAIHTPIFSIDMVFINQILKTQDALDLRPNLLRKTKPELLSKGNKQKHWL